MTEFDYPNPPPPPIPHTPSTLHTYPMPRFLWSADSMQPRRGTCNRTPGSGGPPGEKPRRARGRLKPGPEAHILDDARICPTVRKEKEEEEEVEDGGGCG